MSAYRKFDPYAWLGRERAKVAKVAKEDADSPARADTLAGLAALAARSAEPADPCHRAIALRELQIRNADCAPIISRTPLRIEIPADWATGVSGIVQKACPTSVESKRWLQLQNDANRFVDEWGRQAVALGWSILDIFGCHPTHPAVRYDCMGLVWLIADAKVIAMGAEVANLRSAAGAPQRVAKGATGVPRIPAWDL
jgi:hypothetical protein